MSSSTRILLGRKAGNEKALFISPGSTMRQLYRPVKRMSPGNLWQIDGYYVGSMWSQERKQRRFPFILTILLTACFPSQDLLDFHCQARKCTAVWQASSRSPRAATAACLLSQLLARAPLSWLIQGGYKDHL